jgi:DNA repair protein RecO (recombination protein O)
MDFAEWDKLIALFTRDFGTLRGIAKGAKRSRKRFGSGLEPLTCVNLNFFEKERAGLVRLEHCAIIASYPGIHGDVVKVGYASYLGELISGMIAEREPHRELFELFTAFLSLLNESHFREELIRIFELRVLALAGYQPEFTRCVVCRKEMKGGRAHRFSMHRGGLVCATCVRGPGEYPLLSEGTIKTLQHAQKVTLDKVTRLFFSEQAQEESRTVLTHFIEYHLERPLRSLRVLDHLKAY